MLWIIETKLVTQFNAKEEIFKKNKVIKSTLIYTYISSVLVLLVILLEGFLPDASSFNDFHLIRPINIRMF